jgi:hypothetical protein
MPARVVRPEYGPSLPELLGPRVRALPRPLRIAGLVALVLVVVAVLVAAIDGGAKRTSLVHRGALPFNLSYPKGIERVAPKNGELARLEQRRGDLFLASYAVEPLTLPPYSGQPDGIFPTYAERLKTELARRFPGFLAVTPEGRVRLNEITTGYAVLFRAKLGERTLYGRAVMLAPPKAAQRDTALLVMLATPAAGISGPAAVGYDGLMTIPYRSFRFGTEKP